ncbi:hypothetical protein A0H81_09395 [Grifola frondosa]|uniref:Uncharacterized protein n=1 Tax=Grifola frondosa TaxID=5627 RepID=A0A1C7M6E9_GRIFR|nr:hypothetical protein A0H81_09395 [Grifola frondosa]
MNIRYRAVWVDWFDVLPREKKTSSDSLGFVVGAARIPGRIDVLLSDPEVIKEPKNREVSPSHTFLISNTSDEVYDQSRTTFCADAVECRDNYTLLPTTYNHKELVSGSRSSSIAWEKGIAL